jgi:UDP-N-acetylmuramoyl-tripeptide--D-alanyl-D-alanine ligase
MIFLYVAATVAFLLFLMVSIVRSMHMFQLNSYKTPTHWRWLGKNKQTLVPGLVGAALAAVLAVTGLEGIIALTMVTVFFGLLAFLLRPRKAKKPLVYTKRVNRMLVTLGVLVALCAAAVVFSGSITVYLIVLGVLSAVSPLLVIVANFLNKPIEQAINNYYINDARRILKSSPELLTVGVTGSYGKTSVKYILHTLLQAEFDTLKTPESYNTPMGVVKTVRSMLRATHQIFVCEMGARHVGDIKELCEIAYPKMGIITSVGPQHLETFHSLDNVKKTKFELADALPADGTVFLNMEDTNIRDHASNVKCRAVTYGLSDCWNYYATDISSSSKGTTFTVHTPDGSSDVFTTAMVGAHNVINIVGAMAICCELGIPLAKLKMQVRKLQSLPHRLELIRRGNITIIDDAFNSNPTGSKAAIDALALFDGCKILITPGMVELGDKQDELNHAFGAYAAKVCDYVMLVGVKQTRSIYEGLVSAGYPENRIYVADVLQDALNRAYSVDSEGKEKIILLENDLPDNF